MSIVTYHRGVVKRIVGGWADPEPGHVFGLGILPEEPTALEEPTADSRQPSASEAEAVEEQLGADYDAWLAAQCAEDFDQRIELDSDADELLDFEIEPEPELEPAPVRAVGRRLSAVGSSKPDPEASGPCTPEVWLLCWAGYHESLGGEGSLWLADRIRHLARLARITQASTFWQIDDREEVLERRCF